MKRTPAQIYVQRFNKAWPRARTSYYDSGIARLMFCTVEVSLYAEAADSIRLEAIYARESGRASMALNWLLDLADALNVKITGTVLPSLGEERLSAKAIWEWEKRHGFVVHPGWEPNKWDGSDRDMWEEYERYRDMDVIYYPGSRHRVP